MECFSILAAGGIVTGLFAIYMYYRSRGVHVFSKGQQRKEMAEMRKEMEALNESVQALRDAREVDREALVDILLAVDDRKRLSVSTPPPLPQEEAEEAEEPQEADEAQN